MRVFQPILLVLGILLTTLGLSMLVPVWADWAVGNPDWQAFAASAGITLFVGGGLWITHAGRGKGELSFQQAFLLTTLAWVVTAVFAALPFALCDLKLGYADAFFEAMSGLTTTGSTVITGLDTAPPGVLIWRAILQWLGGVGIIVMAVAILPMLQVGGMQLFHLESSDRSEKMLPRAAQFATSIALLYVIISATCALAYYLAGMTPFDSVAHAMTTVATGGYSTKDASIAAFDSVAIDTIAIVFMVLGGLPFALYLLMLRGNFRAFVEDRQVRLFLGLLVILIAVMTVHQVMNQINEPGQALRYAAFNIVSVLTGTGYATTDYSLWGGFAVSVFFFTMFIGGCAGSTSCGIKIFRFHVLWAAVDAQVKRVMLPHGVFVPRYGRRVLSDDVISSVTSYMFLFALIFCITAVLLALHGLDTITALSAAGTALANVGPGLGPVVGPSGSFASLDDTAKWILSIAMLLGRLELFTVLVLFVPSFWR